MSGIRVALSVALTGSRHPQGTEAVAGGRVLATVCPGLGVLLLPPPLVCAGGLSESSLGTADLVLLGENHLITRQCLSLYHLFVESISTDIFCVFSLSSIACVAGFVFFCCFCLRLKSLCRSNTLDSLTNTRPQLCSQSISIDRRAAWTSRYTLEVPQLP